MIRTRDCIIWIHLLIWVSTKSSDCHLGMSRMNETRLKDNNKNLKDKFRKTSRLRSNCPGEWPTGDILIRLWWATQVPLQCLLSPQQRWHQDAVHAIRTLWTWGFPSSKLLNIHETPATNLEPQATSGNLTTTTTLSFLLSITRPTIPAAFDATSLSTSHPKPTPMFTPQTSRTP